jgi:hypothetical protein
MALEGSVYHLKEDIDDENGSLKWLQKNTHAVN